MKFSEIAGNCMKFYEENKLDYFDEEKRTINYIYLNVSKLTVTKRLIALELHTIFL